jgi:hypothetical protein
MKIAYLCLDRGILTQLAAATATNGTYRATRGGARYRGVCNKRQDLCVFIQTYALGSHNDNTIKFKQTIKIYSILP